MTRSSEASPLEPPRQQVVRSNFRDQAVDILREQILDGTYPSGSRLNEVEIAAEMGISRGPLREALQRLVVAGLVEVIPHRGAAVRSFTVTELQQMYEFREIIETGAARLAASRASREDIAALRATLDEVSVAIAADPDAPYPAAPDLHRRILELAGNPSLLQAGTELQSQVRIARRLSVRNPGRSQSAHTEHLEIIGAIALRDPDAAGDAMKRHLANSLSSVEWRQAHDLPDASLPDGAECA